MKKENVLNKKFTKGFTLIELLVVVLIIGILAAIALPQYKMAVAKSKFTTVKNITKDLKSAAERFYLTNNNTNYTSSSLDISYRLKSVYNTDSALYLGINENINCTLWKNENKFACYINIYGTSVGYYIMPSGTKGCTAFSKDKKDMANKLCQQETNGKKPTNGPDYYGYTY